MADTVVAASLSLNTSDADKSVKNFKTELRDAQQQLVGIADKFGATSKEAVNAAKRVAELRDRIQDANSLAAAFNPDRKFVALGQAVQGVTGGFAALQGVMGLLGQNSENVQKQLLKVQSALAITQGLDNIRDSVQGFKNLAATIGGQVVKAFSTLKGAIAATGIGLLVVGIGALIANFDKLTEWLGLTSNATREFNREMDNLEATSPQVAEHLQELGKTAQEIAENFIKELRGEVRALNEELGRAPSSAEEAGAAIRLLQADFNGLIADLAKAEFERGTAQGFFSQLLGISSSPKDIKKKIDANKKAQQDVDQALEDQFNLSEIKRAKKEQELFDKEQQRIAERANAKAEADRKRREEERIRIEKENKEFLGVKLDAPENDPEVLAENEKVRIIGELRQGLFDRTKFITDQEKTLAESRVAISEWEKSLRVQNALEIGNALGALSDLVGKETLAGKVLGIAQATINTFVGASEVLRAKTVIPEPFGTISKIANVAAIIATGLAAVKNIVKTQVPGRSGGGSVPSVNLPTSSPLLPQPQVNTTQLDQQSLNRVGNAAVRSFVLESDIQNAQERLRRLNRAARLGG